MARSSSSTIALAVLIGAAGTFAVVDAHAGTCPELIGPVQEMGDSFHAGASTRRGGSRPWSSWGARSSN
jgi:hypothetical protein